MPLTRIATFGASSNAYRINQRVTSGYHGKTDAGSAKCIVSVMELLENSQS